MSHRGSFLSSSHPTREVEILEYPLSHGEFANGLRGFGKGFWDDRELNRGGGDFHEGCPAVN